MRTVLKNKIVESRSFDDFVQSKHVLMLQIFMYVYFRFEHLQVGPSEFLQLDNFDCVSFMNFLYLHCFINFTTETFSQFIVSRVFILTDSQLRLLEGV